MERETGRISNWNADRGFGFVRSGFRYDDDAFVHISELPSGMSVDDDTYISFIKESTRKGTVAKSILDITEETRNARAIREAQDKILEAEHDAFLEPLEEEYLKRIAEVEEDRSSAANYLKYINKLEGIYKDVRSKYTERYDSDGLWYTKIDLDVDDLNEELRECSNCQKPVWKKEINSNYSTLRIYTCDPCVSIVEERKRLERIETESKIDDIFSTINLSSLTKKSFKELCRTLLKLNTGLQVTEMDDNSRNVIGLVITNGSYNIGYFAPGSGSSTSSIHGWRSSGKFLRRDISWRSKKGNYCRDSETFRFMGSIDDNWDTIKEKLNEC